MLKPIKVCAFRDKLLLLRQWAFCSEVSYFPRAQLPELMAVCNDDDAVGDVADTAASWTCALIHFTISLAKTLDIEESVAFFPSVVSLSADRITQSSLIIRVSSHVQSECHFFQCGFFPQKCLTIIIRGKSTINFELNCWKETVFI